MKKLLPILLLAGFSTAVHAGGLSTRHSTSLQLAIDGGHTEYTRMGASYSISGTNVTTTHTVGTGDDATTTTGGLGVQSYATTGVATPGTITAGQGTTNGTGSFSFAQSFTQADIAGTGSEYADFGNVTAHAAGSTGGTGAPGTITNGHVVTISQGVTANGQTTGTLGAGSQITAQFVTEITAF